MKLYVEWIDETGNFCQGEFASWADYHEVFFNPQLRVLKIVERK